MMVHAIWGLLAALVYGSFLEWFIHKHVMHTKKFSRLAFERHVVDHHATRRSLKNFYIPPQENKSYDALETSVVPILWAVHAPLYALLWWRLGMPVAVGVAAGCLLYIAGYEVLHFFIHAPKNYAFQRTRLFRFYCEYHRVHHLKPRLNYNIVLPLADVVLRTISLERMKVEPNTPDFVPPDTGPTSVFDSNLQPGEPESRQAMKNGGVKNGAAARRDLKALRATADASQFEPEPDAEPSMREEAAREAVVR